VLMVGEVDLIDPIAVICGGEPISGYVSARVPIHVWSHATPWGHGTAAPSSAPPGGGGRCRQWESARFRLPGLGIGGLSRPRKGASVAAETLKPPVAPALLLRLVTYARRLTK
jgi:hypothetical protein